jgi:hypothetical protein
MSVAFRYTSVWLIGSFSGDDAFYHARFFLDTAAP